MQIILIEPYYTGSHQYWADRLQQHSSHIIKIISLKGKYWKWRLQASAIEIYHQLEQCKPLPDLIICSDMTDLSLLKSLMNEAWRSIPLVLYMHENQLSYPFSKRDRELRTDYHYGFINYKSCLVADKVVFNSQFHQNEFLEALEALLRRMPDHKSLDTVVQIRSRSLVLPIGIDAEIIHNSSSPTNTPLPVLLWNHRWEYDKRPDIFIRLCQDLIARKVPFKINFLGKPSEQYGTLIYNFTERNADRINHLGFASSREEYFKVLQNSNILPVTSEHDFFGIAVLEAIYTGCYPILPTGMVYSEHILPGYEHHFYNAYESLVQKTESVIHAILAKAEKEKIEIRDYSWKTVIRAYDTFFEKQKKAP